MPNVGKNIRFLRQQIGMTLKQLADAAGIDLSNLSKLERGETGFRAETIARLSIALGVPEAALFTEESAENVVEMNARRVPVLSPEQAAQWTGFERHTLPSHQQYLFLDLRSGQRSFALVVPDDSMLPTFTEGDIVIADPDIQPRPADTVVATVDKQPACLRQYRVKAIDKYHREIIELVPVNQFFPTISAESQDIRVVGTVREQRRFRRLS
jgi:transcriptional regulator with XRE-family HTH domain